MAGIEVAQALHLLVARRFKIVTTGSGEGRAAGLSTTLVVLVVLMLLAALTRF